MAINADLEKRNTGNVCCGKTIGHFKECKDNKIAELEKRNEAEMMANIELHQRILSLEKRNNVLEESKCSKAMLDETKKLFEEMKASRDEWEVKAGAYRELASKYWMPKNGPIPGIMFGKKEMKLFEEETRKKENILDAEVQRILSTKGEAGSHDL